MLILIADIAEELWTEHETSSKEKAEREAALAPNAPPTAVVHVHNPWEYARACLAERGPLRPQIRDALRIVSPRLEAKVGSPPLNQALLSSSVGLTRACSVRMRAP